VLNIAVSTTLLSYIAIFPALWRLRVTHPDHPRPYRAPFAPFLSVWLTLCIAFASVEIFAPGIGIDWFGGKYTPDKWAQSERLTYLRTQLVPLVIFIAMGVLFWAVAGKTRSEKA
jgi:amino acid transporter